MVGLGFIFPHLPVSGFPVSGEKFGNHVCACSIEWIFVIEGDARLAVAAI